MKKVVKFIPVLLLMIVGGITMSSCDDKDETISYDSLPKEAKSFIEQYYPAAYMTSATKDNNEYEVVLSDGTRIEFNKSGEWKDVDAPVGKTIAAGFYPTAIDTYVSTNFTGTGINEISKETHGYDVELVNGIDLEFNHQGQFIGYDR